MTAAINRVVLNAALLIVGLLAHLPALGLPVLELMERLSK